MAIEPTPAGRIAAGEKLGFGRVGSPGAGPDYTDDCRVAQAAAEAADLAYREAASRMPGSGVLMNLPSNMRDRPPGRLVGEGLEVPPQPSPAQSVSDSSGVIVYGQVPRYADADVAGARFAYGNPPPPLDAVYPAPVGDHMVEVVSPQVRHPSLLGRLLAGLRRR